MVKKRPHDNHDHDGDQMSQTESEMIRRKVSTKVEFLNDPRTLPLGPPKFHPFADKLVTPWEEWVQTLTLAVETYV